MDRSRIAAVDEVTPHKVDTGVNTVTKHVRSTAESLLQGTGLLSKRQAFRRSGVSWSTFIRALSINFAGHQSICGKSRPPALKAIHFQTSSGRIVVGVAPKDLKRWKQKRSQLNHNGLEKKKRSQSIQKIGDQARRRTNGSAT